MRLFHLFYNTHFTFLYFTFVIHTGWFLINIHCMLLIVTDKQEVGVHINTTFSVASSKKIKLLFILNFSLIILCMVVSCSISFYYWTEMISTRKQLDSLRDQFITKNQEKIQSSPLVAVTDSIYPDIRHPRMESGAKVVIPTNARRYFVDNLGEDILLMDSGKKIPTPDKMPIVELSLLQRGEF